MSLVRSGSPDAPTVVVVPELMLAARDLRALINAWVAAGWQVALCGLFESPQPPPDYRLAIRELIPEAVHEGGPGTLLTGIGFGGHLALFSAAAMGVSAPPVATIASGRVEVSAAPSTGIRGMFEGFGESFGSLGNVFGRSSSRIASDDSADEARLAEVTTRVLTVAIADDRSIPFDAVARLACALNGNAEVEVVKTGARPNTHLRWFRVDPGPVVATVSDWGQRIG